MLVTLLIGWVGSYLLLVFLETMRNRARGMSVSRRTFKLPASRLIIWSAVGVLFTVGLLTNHMEARWF